MENNWENGQVMHRNNVAEILECWFIPISTRTEETLKLKINELRDWICTDGKNETIGDISYTMCCCREHYEKRKILVVSSVEELLFELEQLCQDWEYFNTSNVEHTIAMQYLSGETVDWKPLFEGKAIQKIPMPTYPFEKVHHWIPYVNSKKEEIPYGKTYIDANISDLNGLKYKKNYPSKKSVYFFQNGEKTYLNPFNYIEMVREVSQAALNIERLELRELKWANPTEWQGIDIEKIARVTKQGETFYCDIHGKEERITFQTMIKNENFESIQGVAQAFDKNMHRDRNVNHVIVEDKSFFMKVNNTNSKIEGWLAAETLVNAFGLVLEKILGQTGAIYFPYEMDSVSMLEAIGEVFYLCGTFEVEAENICFDCEVRNQQNEVIQVYRKLCWKKWKQEKKGRELVFAQEILKEKSRDTNPTGKDVAYVVFEDAFVEHGFHTFRNALDKHVVFVQRGEQFVKISENHYKMQHNNPNHYQMLLDAIKQDKIYVIYHWANSPFSERTEDIVRQLDNSLKPLILFLKELGKNARRKQVKLAYVYQEKKHEQPIYKAISCFLRSVQLELTNLEVMTVSVERLTGEVVENIMKDFEAHDTWIRYEQEKRLVRAIQVKDLTGEDEVAFKEGEYYLITGGLGGIGIEVAKILLAQWNVNLILLGRSKADAETVKERLALLKTLSGQVDYIEADISKQDGIKKVEDYLSKKEIALSGILHCAGMSKDKLFLDKPEEEYFEVLMAKLFGTIQLNHLLEKFQPKLCMLFSSVAAIKGNIGQADYSFANGFMDSYIPLLRERYVNTNVVSVNWTVWEKGTMKLSEDKQKNLEETIGFAMLPSQAGVQAMNTIVTHGMGNCIVGYGDAEKIESYLCEEEQETQEASTVEEGVADEVLYSETIEFLIRLFSEVFRLPKESIDSKVEFKNYGIDSVIVMNFNHTLEQYIKTISKVLLYQYHTIHEIAEYMIEHHKAELLVALGLLEQESDKSDSAKAKEQGIEEWDRLQKKGSLAYGQSQNRIQDIAIIGMSGRFPMADNVDELWDNLVSGTDCITTIPEERWDYKKYFSPDSSDSVKGKMYSKWGGFINNADQFDPMFFNITPKEAELMDPQERLLLEEAWKILEDAGYSNEKLEAYKKSYNGYNVGVFAAVTTMTYSLLASEQWKDGIVTIPNSLQWSMANRISYTLDLNGPSIPVDTACSSALTAVHLACESLYNKECKLALVEGVNLYLHPARYIGMCQMNMLSPTGRCHTFSANSDGFVPGEGVGGILLKPLDQAVEDGDHIYAVIKSTSINHGGMTSGYKVPNPNAQSDLIVEAFKRANINPRSINYIETHGTGTKLGDPIEIAGLVKAFSEYTKDTAYCALGSVKSNIGHLESAAGIASIIKVIQQMQHKQLVPSIHCEEINPNIILDNTQFYIQRELETWEQVVVEEDGKEVVYPRRAGVSSFGAGGGNGHVILEEYIEKPREQSTQTDNYVFVLSAKSEERLHAYAKKILAFLEEKESVDFEDFIYTLQVGRNAMEYRMALVTTSREDLIRKIKQYLANEMEGIFTGYVKRIAERKENVSDTALDVVAKKWVENYKVTWEDYYKARPNIISIPTYPFERETYWLPDAKGKEEAREVQIHPMVGKNVSTLREQKFVTNYTGTEFFITDHRINGNAVLPGAAYIEMARVVLELSLEMEISCISNVSWLRPIVFRGQSIAVYTRLKVKNGICYFEIYSKDTKGGKQINCEGEVIIAQQERVNFTAMDDVIDTQSIVKYAEKEIHKQSFYDAYQEAGYVYGETMQAFQSAFVKGREAVVQLEIPEQTAKEQEMYVLHPTLLDGAFQAVSTLLSGKETEGKVYMPFQLDKIMFLKEFNKVKKVYIRLQNEESKSEVLKLDLFMTDENNIPYGEVRGFTTRAMNTNGVKHNALLDVLVKLKKGEVTMEEVKQYIGRDKSGE